MASQPRVYVLDAVALEPSYLVIYRPYPFGPHGLDGARGDIETPRYAICVEQRTIVRRARDLFGLEVAHLYACLDAA